MTAGSGAHPGADPGALPGTHQATDHGAYQGAPALPEITAACTGCGRCVGACPPHVLWLETRHWKKTAVLHMPQACTGCARCAVVCPFHAIRMRRSVGAAGGAASSGSA